MSSDLLILSGSEVDKAVAKFTPRDLVDLMARVFIDLARSSTTQSDVDNTDRVTIPHRSVIKGTNHQTLYMPSRIPSFGSAIKIVSVPTANAPGDIKANGLPGSTAVIDDRTGEVVALVNARKLTASRNAASSLLATNVMLSTTAQEPSALVAIGAGAQISAHVSLFLSSYPSIRNCTIFNRTSNDRLTLLVDSLRTSHPHVRIEGLALTDGEGSNENPELKTSIQAANIIITATSSTRPLFPSSYVSSGTHLCLIGSYTPTMHEIDGDLVKRASKIVVDYKEGVLVEAGEILAAGVGRESLVELGELLEYEEATQWSKNISKVQETVTGDVTIFKSVGVGIQDVAIARAVVDVAGKYGLGCIINGYQ